MNRIENLVLIILTLAVVRIVMIQPLLIQLDRQNQTIERLAEREKYSYQILNSFEKKLKSKDGKLIIDLNNTMNNEALNNDSIIDTDSIPPSAEKKDGFFKRLFHSRRDK